MRVSIHQPEHLPWLGFFHKMTMVDLFVVLDNVQYRHKYYQNRNRIPGPNGELWLRVPILHKGKQEQLISEVCIDLKSRWQQKAWRSIALVYGKAPYFSAYAAEFEAIYMRDWDRLIDLNLELISLCLRLFTIQLEIVRASSLVSQGRGEALILDLCKAAKADTYISGVSGIAGKGCEHEIAFREAGIAVVYQEFHHPIYTQLKPPFIPCMSAIDLLFNYGPESRRILMGEGGPVMEKVFL